MKPTKQNVRNIKCIFEEKTGVDLNPAHRQQPKKSVKWMVLVAAAVICGLMMAACGVALFSPLNGDELSLSGTYEGNGIVSIFVENGSDKSLTFQKQLKLMCWSTSEEVERLDGEIVFQNTSFPAHSSGTMTIDISRAYDIAALEQGLPEMYYFLLTNNDFFFGHDWMCSFRFRPEETGTEETSSPEHIDASLLRAQAIDEIEEDLRFYFEDAYYDELPAFNQTNFVYLQKVQELLMRTEGTLVHPVDPWIRVEIPEDHVFDEAFPLDIQHQLVGENYYSIDGYKRIVGSMFSGTGSDYALTLKAQLPGYEGQTNGGRDLPLIYLFVYEKADLTVEKPYAFIYGQILTFEEMAQYQVFEDERYVVYEVTDLFYTDLDRYMEYFLSVESDVYFDEQICARVHHIYDYLKDKETLGSLIVNHQAEAEAMGFEEAPEEIRPPKDVDLSLPMAQTIGNIEEDLRFYFEDAYADQAMRSNGKNAEYMQKVQELLARFNRTVVPPVDSALTVDKTPEGVVFDETYPMERQYELVGEYRPIIDGYGRIVAGFNSPAGYEHALTLDSLLPLYQGEVGGGAGIPLIYMFTYEVSAIQEDSYAFLYGQLLSFGEMEPYKVYQDGQYAVYEVTDLFYTDLDAYIDYFLTTRDDIYFDEQIRQRVHNIYDYYKDKETLGSQFYYNLPE